MMRVTDKLIAPSRGTIEEVERWCKSHDRPVDSFLRDYLNEAFRLAPLVSLDASIVVSQSAHECFNPDTGKPWDSFWYRTRGNVAGIGITGDPTQNAASKTFADGIEAARAHVVHLWLYAAAGSATPEVLKPYYKLDPRAGALLEEEWAGTVKTIAGLSGTWAVDPHYAEGIVARGNALFVNLPNQEMGGTVPDITFGRVKHPPVEIRDILSSVNHAWDALGKRTIRGIVWHRSLGSHTGNDQYFRGEGASRALTDFGIGVKAQDGDALAGSLYRWNDPHGDRSPWANGSVSAPYGDGKAFVDRYGVSAVNRDLTSVEISGFETTPLDPQSRQAIAALTAYWADQYHVSHETFPLIPSEGGRSFVLWHEEITFGTGKRCPFAAVKAETNDLIDRARAILKRAQTEDAPMPEPQPEPTIDFPEGMDAGLAEAWFGKVTAKGTNYGFNPSGGVSRLWVANGKQTGRWPKLAKVETYGARTYFRFVDGLTIWRPNDQSAVAVLK